MRALSDATAGMLKPLNLSSRDKIVIDVDKDLKHFVVRITTSDEGEYVRSYPSTAATRAWLGRVPERKELKDRPNTWMLAATDYTAEIIRAVWPAEQIEWKSSEAETLFDYLLLSTTQQDMNAEAYGKFKESGELPDSPLEFSSEHPLAPYQRCAGAIALRSEGYGLFKEQGTGKTPVAISVVCTAASTRDWRQPYRVLVVAPKNVRRNWVREFERFATQPGKVEVIKGGKIDRMALLIETIAPEQDCKYSVCIMSYEAMTRDIEFLTSIEWDLVMLDEGHYIKWPETQRAKAAFKLRDAARKRMVLTGTPVCNSPLDLYSLFEFMGEGWSGFKRWENFRQFYGVFKDVNDGTTHQKLVAVQNLPFMKERLARLSFIIRKDEALPDLPDKVYDTDDVQMTKAQADAYERVANDLLVKIENELDSTQNKSMSVNNILTQLLRLAQITCGYVTWDPVFDLNTLEEVRPKSIEWFGEDPKLERLVQILKGHGEPGDDDYATPKTDKQKTIIWSCFVPCIKRISERLTAEGIDHVTFYGGTSEADRIEAERRFNEDQNCRVLIGNPAAGGTGLNLLGYPPHAGETAETNCDHVIYYAQDWSYVKRAQSEDRCHRRGTRSNVRVTDLVVPDTIDEEIRVRVLKKKMVALEIADIREILSAVVHGLKVKKESDE